MDLDKAMDFLSYVEQRHRVWEKRQAGHPQPWTLDPIIASRKFTNVYRVLDYGSQFLLADLLHSAFDEREVLMRSFLYRHTNLPPAWKAFNYVTGAYPSVRTLENLREYWHYYRDQGHKVFSGAYMIYPQSTVPGTDKIQSVTDLTERLFSPDSPDDIMPDFLDAENQQQRFAVLRRNKGVADFMSMQILTDWGYSRFGEAGLENEFVVPGPGAKKGAKFIDPTARPEVTLEWAWKAIQDLDVYIDLPDGRIRRPSKMDAQNCLCEFSKYVRYAYSPTRQQLYKPTHPEVTSVPVLPGHW